MYKRPGVRSSAWLTEKEETYGPLKGIGNYGLVPVGYKYENEEWEKTKKQLEQDFQKIRKSAKTASKSAGKYIAKSFKENPGYWVGVALETFGWAAKYGGIPGLESIGDGLIILGFGSIGGQLITSTRRKNEEKKEYRERMKLQMEILKNEKKQSQLLEEVLEYIRNDGDLKERLGAKGMKSIERKVRRLERIERSLESDERLHSVPRYHVG